MVKHDVTVYMAEWCPWCHRAMEWMKENKISFKSIDVEKNPKAAQDMVKKSGQTGIPVIDIDGQIIIGFNVEALKKALGMK